jgi:hypothetical protein
MRGQLAGEMRRFDDAVMARADAMHVGGDR